MSDPILHPTADRLQSFVEGVLDEAERAVVESHLVGCPACQGETAEWRSLFSVLATLPQHAPSAGFADRVMALVKLPDPWYVRAAARASTQVQAFIPKTTRGWALASAFLAAPALIIGALAAWVLSRPYVTPQGLLTFAIERGAAIFGTARRGTLSTLLQSDIALGAARAMEIVSNAGVGAATALIGSIAVATALSAWVLYQNLIRKPETREDHNYVSYSF